LTGPGRVTLVTLVKTFFMEPEIPKKRREALNFRVDRQVKRDYARACQLLGTTQTGPVFRAILSTIRRAKEHFPQHWGLLSDYEELVIEAIEERHQELDQIVDYSRLPKQHVIELLAALCDRGVIGEGQRSKADQARGAVQKVYILKKRITAQGVVTK
jgi:antitoxin component of RelBE/YafQ-DinJ toxin-antitoxin module